MNTDELIARLAKGVQPVRPLRSPWVRAAMWVGLALAYTAAIVLVVGLRRDLTAKVMDLLFLIEQIAALAIAVTAAAAAFAMTVPGRGRIAASLPVLLLTVWLGSLGAGPALNLFTALQGPPPAFDWRCLPVFALVSLGPAAAMVVMIRRGAPLTPRAAMILGGLAAAGIGSFGVRLHRQVDESLTVLVWQVGCLAFLAIAALLAAKRLFNRRSNLESIPTSLDGRGGRA